MKTVENSYALASSVRDLNCRGIHLRWSFSLSLFDQRGSSAESGLFHVRALAFAAQDALRLGCAAFVRGDQPACRTFERFARLPRLGPARPSSLSDLGVQNLRKLLCCQHLK